MLLVGALVAIFLPIEAWGATRTVSVIRYAACAITIALVLLVRVPVAVIDRLDRDFYAQNIAARADRAFRVFYDLLEKSHTLFLATPESRPEMVQQWDIQVRAELAVYCQPVRSEMYYVHTRAIGPERGPDIPLGADRIGIAQDALSRLLHAITHDMSRTVK